MENPLFKKMKKAGCKFKKTQWPKYIEADLKSMGIAREEVFSHTHSATIHETMGPSWKYGFFINGRPVAFNIIGEYHRGGKYNG